MKVKRKPRSNRVASNALLGAKKPRAWQVVLDEKRKVQAMDMEDGTFSFRFLNGDKKKQIRLSREAVIAMQALISHELDA